jgi:hypothetical protein
MAVTEQQVRAHLDPEEPNYPAAAQLGPDALPVLEQLVRGPDPLLASKAAYLAALIPHENASRVLEAAAKSSDVTVRVAAAAGLRRLPDAAESLAMDLVDDHDEGVRKVALRSVKDKMTPRVRRKVQERASREHNPAMRAAYAAVLEKPVGLEDTAHGGGTAGAEQPATTSSGGAAGQGGGEVGHSSVASSALSDVGPDGGGGGDLGRGSTSGSSGTADGPAGGGSAGSGSIADAGTSPFGGGQI